ncbi:hypothetical protein [Microcoleus sp. Pol17_C1]|uniref:hypothetical protein n=2 Tax=Microcoleus TaxID=44471 RepID=UPI002FD6B382
MKRALIASLLLVLAGCSQSSSHDKLVKTLKTVQSWTATMNKIREIALGIVTTIGGFLDIGAIATAAEAGSSTVCIPKRQTVSATLDALKRCAPSSKVMIG